MSDMIEFTQDSFLAFVSAYIEAKEFCEETFEFEGKQFLTAYAKYVIEYVEGRHANLRSH